MPISRRELLRCLLDLGYTGPSPRGSHQLMFRGRSWVIIPNPHGAQEIDDALLSRILRQAGISREEFERVRRQHQ